VPGELCISGAGVARGYFRDAERTAAHFVENPFDAASPRLYRTGDVARRLPDGALQLVGRSDQQVKLRGFRIELGDIEAVLARQPGVAACAVALKRDSGGHARLVGYYTEAGAGAATPAVLRAALAGLLPDYMVPTGWVRLDRMPATPNGKLDRRALPETDWVMADARPPYVAPRNALEGTLAGVFADVLQLPQVGIDDDLIVLGADSIHLFQITARANAAGVRLAAKDLMQHRTIARLATALGEAEPPASAPLALRDAARLRAGRTPHAVAPAAGPS
jgi:aryl carrier-like protein